MAFASPNIGTFSCEKTAQTCLLSDSLKIGKIRVGAPVLSKALKVKR